MSGLVVDGRKFDCLRGSDIDRDGMYLELNESGGQSGVAEIFYSDQCNNFTLNTFGNDIPMEAIEWLIDEAKKLLPANRA